MEIKVQLPKFPEILIIPETKDELLFIFAAVGTTCIYDANVFLEKHKLKVGLPNNFKMYDKLHEMVKNYAN